MKAYLRRLPGLVPAIRAAKRIKPAFKAGLADAARVVVPTGSKIGPPKRTFSAHALLKKGSLPGHIKTEDQGALDENPASMVSLCHLNQNREQPWPVFWTRHRHVRLIGPSLALLDERSDLAVESVFGKRRAKSDPAWNTCPFASPQHLEGQWTSIVSRWLPNDQPVNYFHWLFDGLPRLMPIAEFGAETKVLIPPHPRPFQNESLQLLGLQEKVRPTAEQHLAIEDYFFSAPTAMTGCYNPLAVKFLRDRFLSKADRNGKTPSRVYITRASNQRRILNEHEVVKLLSAFGFEMIDPAQLTFRQQIQLFANAEVICGAHGAAFTNTVWCKRDCVVIELFSHGFLNGCFEWIAACVGAKHQFMVCPSDASLNATVDLKQLKALLKQSQ